MIYLLILFAGVYPIANSIQLTESVGLASITGGLLLVAAPFFAAKKLFSKSGTINVGRPIWNIALLFLFCALSGFWAYQQPLFQSGIMTLFQTLLLLLIFDVFIEKQEEVKWLYLAFIAGTVALALFIGMDYLVGDTYQGEYETLEQDRYSLGGADPNIMAMHLAIGIALVLGHRISDWSIGLNYALAAFLFLGVILTGSRTAFVASLAVLSIFVLFQGQLRQAIWQWLGLIICFLAVYMLWDFRANEISLERVTDMFDQGLDTSLAGREAIWPNAIQTFNDHPLVGIGYGTFAAYHDDNFGPALVAHSTHLSFLAETGIIGYALFLWVYSYFPRYLMRLKEGMDRKVYLALFAVLILASITLNLAEHFSFWIFMVLLHKQLRLSKVAVSNRPGAHRNPDIERRLQALRQN